MSLVPTKLVMVSMAIRVDWWLVGEGRDRYISSISIDFPQQLSEALLVEPNVIAVSNLYWFSVSDITPVTDSININLMLWSSIFDNSLIFFTMLCLICWFFWFLANRILFYLFLFFLNVSWYEYNNFYLFP